MRNGGDTGKSPFKMPRGGHWVQVAVRWARKVQPAAAGGSIEERTPNEWINPHISLLPRYAIIASMRMSMTPKSKKLINPSHAKNAMQYKNFMSLRTNLFW